jgi:hypothetical protein
MPPPDAPPPVQARLTRESSERQRALALIERKKREAALAAAASTPSTSYGLTPYGGNETPGYSDQFNTEEVQLAHRSKDYVERWRSGGARERRWDEDDDRGMRGRVGQSPDKDGHRSGVRGVRWPDEDSERMKRSNGKERSRRRSRSAGRDEGNGSRSSRYR